MKQRQIVRLRASAWLTRNAIWLIVLLAWLLALYQIAARTWHGDELSSVANALGTRQNPQALLYFSLLRFWLWGGNSEFWLRALSAIFAVLNVAITYRAVNALSTRRAALVVSLLIATSPFILEFSQQVRFYTVFLAAASASIWAFLYFLKKTTCRAFAIWLVTALVMLTTHAMAFLVLLFQVVTLWLLLPRIRLRYRIGALLLVVALGALVIFSPLRVSVFAWVARYTDALPVFDQSRGISVSQLAKVPLTFFFFALGQYVYPLDWYLAVPGLVLYAVAIGAGMYQLRNKRAWLLFLLLLGLGAPLMLYLVLDALIPSTFAGAAPRYLIFLLPVFYFLAGIGAASLRGGRAGLIVGLVLVNLLAIFSMWRAEWAYTDDLVDWRVLTQFVKQEFTPDTQIFLDGRANGNAQFYFPPDVRSALISQTVRAQPETTRAIVIASDFHAGSRQNGNALLRELQKHFTFERSWSKYPAFVQILSRRHKPSDTFSVDAATGRIELPVELYGLEFQDVRLPAEANFSGQHQPLFGAFAVAPDAPRVLPLAKPTAAQTLWMLSNVIGSPKSAVGDIVAELVIEFDDGTQQNIPLRNGYETGRWDGACESCETAFQWHKRLALLGAAAYPGSWNDFQAGIFAAPLELKSRRPVTSIALKGLRSDETLYVWGLFLR